MNIAAWLDISLDSGSVHPNYYKKSYVVRNYLVPWILKLKT